MKFGYMPNDNLLLSVIRRIDLDGDARLNFNEFMDIVRPLEKNAPRKEIKSSFISQSKTKSNSLKLPSILNNHQHEP
jgi:Ca2+-binding EF-hand superfamily protein